MDWGILSASIALVLVTGGLVYFTWGLVDEARKTRDEMKATRDEMVEARLAGVRPHIVMTGTVLAPLYGVLSLQNLGPGFAKDLRVSITFSPMEEVREWAWPTLAPGDRHDFFLPQAIDNLDAAVAADLTAIATGTCADILAQEYPLDLRFEFAPWWTAARQANRRFERAHLETMIPHVEKAAKALEKIASKG